MKRNSIFKITVAAVLVSQVSFAAGPIVWPDTTMIKNLKPGVDLYESTNAEHPNRYFTERTLFYVGEQVGNPDLQKQVRSEICASDAIYRAAPVAVESAFLPGSMGFYLHDGEVAAIADAGLAGKPLSRIIDELKYLPEADKIVKAKYYVANMLYLMKKIHAGDILWNEFDLSNFYVRPDGKLYALDFSRAKKSAVAAEKEAEVAKLVRGPIHELYIKLFPKQDALDKLNAVLNATAAGHNLATAWTDALLTAEVEASIAALAAGFDANIALYLNDRANVPRLPGLPMGDVSLLRASHQTGAGKVGYIHLDPQVAALIINPTTGVAYPNEIQNDAGAPANDFCNGWTGNE